MKNNKEMAINTENKLRDIKKIIQQEKFSEFKIVSRPHPLPVNGGNELFIPVQETEAVYISERLFPDDLKEKWDNLILSYAIQMEELLIESLHHYKK